MKILLLNVMFFCFAGLASAQSTQEVPQKPEIIDLNQRMIPADKGVKYERELEEQRKAHEKKSQPQTQEIKSVQVKRKLKLKKERNKRK